MRRVAILGGGMAGLAAAWSLSAGTGRDEYEITVYQRGWRLGGKGASSRGTHGRIEEHGLHVWLGYYDNAFELIREVYRALDRPATDPACPIATWRDAFTPADRLGVGDRSAGSWSHWVATFARNDAEPGAGPDAGRPLSVATFVRRAIGLLADFAASAGRAEAGRAEAGRAEAGRAEAGRHGAAGPGAVVLSGSGRPPRRTGPRFAGPPPTGPPPTGPLLAGPPPTSPPPAGPPPTGPPPAGPLLAGLDEFRQQAEIAAMVGAVEAIRLLRSAAPRSGSATGVFLDSLARIEDGIAARLRRDDTSRRTADLADLVITCLRGSVRDGLLTDPAGFAAIDHLDFRVWLARHGASAQTLDSPLVRGMYDLVFAYEDGDRERPGFAAGLGLFLAGKLFFEYKGSIFWQMRAGMGDVVFAPLYQALRARGVRFEFFHRVDRLHLSPDRRSVEAVTLGRQARLAAGTDRYEPLTVVGGLPTFPAEPRADQLDGAVGPDLESHWSDRGGEEEVRLAAGTDFDGLILATSLGMIPYVCGDLLADSVRWRDMVDSVATVPTQALQVWLRASEDELGWPYPGATVSGYATPFDTYASMSHLIGREAWTGDQPPRTIGYFCSVLPKKEAADPHAAHRVVRANAVDFLNGRAGHFWPRAVSREGTFRWDLLCGAGSRSGPGRLDTQYWRANVDPSDQYVQSLPGTGARRLRADESGYDNLFLAGDWINSGLNAGCIEAAVMAGIQAANGVRGRPLTEGVIGTWYGLEAT